jgi:hypothetical protein
LLSNLGDPWWPHERLMYLWSALFLLDYLLIAFILAGVVFIWQSKGYYHSSGAGGLVQPNHPLQRAVTSIMLHVKRRAGLGVVARSADRRRWADRR